MIKITNGWVNGFLGMLIFSGSLPATRVAVSGFNPFFLTCIRATIAALLGLSLLLIFKAKKPQSKDMISLLVVALGVVVGFPLFTALALQHVTSSYSVVFIGLLPLSTAIFGVLRANERPQTAFWLFACLGSSCVAGFALLEGFNASTLGNAYMVAAIVVCGLGYAEGAKLSRTLGGWQVISWALLLALPAMAPLAYMTQPESLMVVKQSAWIGLAYVSVFSMLIGFVFWYRGLAQGGIAAIGQLQLLQPFFGLLLSAIILHETVSWLMALVTILVVLCVIAAKRFSS